jgi:hypothetical protein
MNKVNLIDYKGKHEIWQDKDIELDPVWDVVVGELDTDKVTDEEFRNHLEYSEYYGVPAYIGKDERLKRLEAEYKKDLATGIDRYYGGYEKKIEVTSDEIKSNCCDSPNIVMVQYHWESKNHYDGVSEYKCTNCGYRQGRWSGKELKDNEEETRYGK